MSEVFIIGLVALSVVAVLIYAVTGRTERDDNWHGRQDGHPSLLARDGRSN